MKRSNGSRWSLDAPHMSEWTRAPCAVGRVVHMPPPTRRPVFRPARPRDARAILHLMQPQVEAGVLLPRTLEDIRANIDWFLVLYDRRRLAACGAIRFLSSDLVELRSVVVAEPFQGSGLGRRLIDALVARAAEAGAGRVCAITSSPGFFERLGFRSAAMAAVPEKIAADCDTCSRRIGCRQVAVVRNVTAGQDHERRRQPLRLTVLPVEAAESAGG